MSKVNPVDFSNLNQIPDIIRFLSQFSKQVQAALANGLNFQDNFVAVQVPVYFGSTTSQRITHGLAVTPIGFLQIQSSQPSIIYNGSSLVLGATFANLRSSVAGTSAVILFF